MINKIVIRLSYNKISYTDATVCLYWNIPQLVNCLHIEAETKWPPFSKLHFQMNFIEWKLLHLD